MACRLKTDSIILFCKMQYQKLAQRMHPEEGLVWTRAALVEALVMNWENHSLAWAVAARVSSLPWTTPVISAMIDRLACICLISRRRNKAR